MRFVILLLLLEVPILMAEAGSAGVVAAGYTNPTPISVAPGQILTFFIHGIGAGISEAMYAHQNPAPTVLAGVSAVFRQVNPDRPVPILGVERVATCADSARECGEYSAITVQIPFEIQAANPNSLQGGPVGGAQLLFFENGSLITKLDLIAVVDQIHILRTCDLLLGRQHSVCAPVVTHADGSRVTPEYPSKAGEQIVLYAVGLGFTIPNAVTGQAAQAASPVSLPFRIGFDPRQNALASRPQVDGSPPLPGIAPTFAGLTAGFIGLYQLNLTVPNLGVGALPCSPSGFGGGLVRIDSNLTITVAGPASFDGVGICVDPLK